MAESEPARSHDVPLGVSELSNARDPDVAPAEDKMAADDHADALSQDTQAIEPVIALTAPGQSNQAIPQQKKFTSSNINKKFLEKTGSGPAPAASQTAAAKPGTPTPKPALASNASHSRLVTTRLTTSPQSAAAAGPGWPRPSSTTPTTVPVTAANMPPPNPISGAPQLPVAAKVIHPAPTQPGSRDGKLAWRATQAPLPPTSKAADSEFPTVGQAPVSDPPTGSTKPTELETARSEALQQEADAFRGIHLDPNAHHWDEMGEDDDNFLEGVVEFEDGKQYTPAPAASEAPVARAPAPEPARGSKDKAKPVDEFDRSWPRATQTAHQASQRDPPPHTSDAAAAPPPRTLFNERSNRLEPVAPHTGQSRWKQDEPSSAPTLFTKRGGLRLAEHAPAPAPLERDHPPHISQSGSQLSTQRPGLETRPTERAWQQGGALKREPLSTQTPAWGPQDARVRDAPPHVLHRLSSHERLGLSTQMPPPPKPVSTSPQSTQARRPSNASSSAPEPPLKQVLILPVSTPQQDVSPQEATPAPAPAPAPAPVPPAAETKPVAADTLSYEEASKAVLQSAAERARQRRLQEEEEREAQRERARQKAAELERRFSQVPEPTPTKTDDAPSADQNPVFEAEVLVVLQDARKTAEPEQAAARDSESAPPPQKTAKLAAMPPTPAVPPPRKLSTASTGPPPAQRPPLRPTTSGSDAGSWRTRPPGTMPTQPQPPPFTQRQAPPPSQLKDQPPSVQPETPAASRPDIARNPSVSGKLVPGAVVGVIESVTIEADEVLEEIDFEDMGKLMGDVRSSDAVSTASPDSSAPPASKPGRLTVSDLSDALTTTTTGSESTSWRRKSGMPASSEVASRSAASAATVSLPVVNESKPVATPTTEAPPPLALVVGRQHVQTLSPLSKPPQLHPAPLRSPRSPTFREAPMAALDDTMSRIRGALDGMHFREPVKPVLENAQLVSPDEALSAIRPPLTTRSQLVLKPTESFVTGGTLPPSPKRAWGTITVSVPKKKHRARAPLDKKQLHFTREPPIPVRWEILSFNPPVAGMSRKSLSVNEILFPRQFAKGQLRYFVVLPKPAKPKDVTVDNNEKRGLVVNLPSRQRDTRVPSTSSSTVPSLAARFVAADARQLSLPSSDAGLDTVSCSPPPDVQVRKAGVNPSSHDPEASASTRARSQPKMPTGKSVAYYRQLGHEEPAPSVNFIVSSEIDAGKPSAAEAASTAPTLHTTALTLHSASQDVVIDASPSNEAASHPRDSPVRETAARLPDPEHLKAVWSQVSANSDAPASNSLKSINDDLTAVPFSLHDVKSEDGGTPPPGMGTPTRMSIHDVTRAFQQVPTSTASSPAQVPISLSPQSSSGPQPRRPSYGFPSPSTAPRPLYPAYPAPPAMGSPMMYPTNMSSVPMARPMVNGHMPQYQQPMWYPVVHSPVPTPGGPVVMHGSYAQPMIGYAPAGMHPGMYTPPVATAVPAPSVTPAGRGRGVPMVPPVVTQTTPSVYPHQSYPSPITPGGRGHPMPPPLGPHAMPSPRAAPSNLTAFTPVPPSYTRAPW